MAEKELNDVVVVVPEKDGGSKLIPVLDATSLRPVESIGSYLSSDSFRKLSKSIFNDITTHKEVLKRFRHLLTRSPKPVITRSPPESPSVQRRKYLRQFSAQSDDSHTFSPTETLQQSESLSSSLYQEKFQQSESLSFRLYQLSATIDNQLIVSDKLIYECIESAGAKVLESIIPRDDSSDLCSKLDSFIQEGKNDYINAVKLSIVKYVLNNRLERKRLNIEQEASKYEPFVTIRAPVPWSGEFKLHKAELERKLFIVTPLLDDVRKLWFTNYHKLNFLQNISFPADVQHFKSQVTVNCEIINSTLKYGFVADATSSFLQRREKNLIQMEDGKKKKEMKKDGKRRDESGSLRNFVPSPGSDDYHLMETVATFTSILIRQLVMNNIETWLDIANNIEGREEKELFVARADYSSESLCQLDPSPAEWPRLVVHPVNELLRVTEFLPRIESQLFISPIYDISGKGYNYIENVKENDYQILEMKKKLLSLICENDSNKLLQEAEEKIRLLENFKRWKHTIYDIGQLRQIIQEQEKFEEAAIYDIEFNWTAGIMLVNYSQLRKKIINEAKESRQVLIKSKVDELISLSHSIIFQLQSIKDELEKVTDSTEDLVSNIKLINEFRMKTHMIFKDIEYVQDNWTFMSEEGAEFLSDTDLELLNTLYYWPGIIRKSFNDSEERLGSSKKKTEGKLRERIGMFERSLKDISDALLHFKKKRLSSPLEKIPDNVKSLQGIETLIDEAANEKISINYEEGLLGWHQMSQFEELSQIRVSKEPLDLLWSTALEFERKHHKWMTTRIPDLDIPKVRFDLERLSNRVDRTEEAFKEAQTVCGETEGDEDLRQNIITLRSRVNDFLTIQLPLLCVIILPVLKEKHWKAMGKILRQEINVNRFSTLTDVTSDSLDKESVSKIEAIGRTAAKEHALEQFLARMKNEWISDEWPEDALDIAANKFLEEENMESDLKTEVVHAFKWIHEFSRSYTSNNEHKFLFPIRLTPPAFIELILTFKQLLKKKQSWITERITRFVGGVQKLELASSFVNNMKRKLIDEDQPRLAETSRQTELLMIQIEEETIDVEWTKEKIASDQGLANRAAALAQQLRDECTKELAEAVPAMESAIKALDTLVPEDIVFLRSLKNPPIGIKMVLESVAILLDFHPDRRSDPVTGYMMNDYWAGALRMLYSSEVKLLESLKVYEKDRVNPVNMRLVRECYLKFTDFDPLALRSTSIACESLAKWVKALDIYDRVINVIKPKKQKLIDSEKELATLLERVYNKRNELQAITDRLQGLSDNFASISKEKKELEENIMFAQQKVERAVTLLDGLEVEKERWKLVTEGLKKSEETLIGDSIIAAAFIVYASGMSATNRAECVENWRTFLKTKHLIQMSNPFNLVQVSTTPLDIQTWILAGLPSDSFNMENAMILTNSKRFCLIIDPLRIGNDFIKKLNQSKGMMILVEDDEMFEGVLVQIKKNITRGKPVLLEDVDLGKLQNPFIQQVLIKDVIDSDGTTVR